MTTYNRRIFLSDTAKYALLAGLYPLGNLIKVNPLEKPLRLIIDADTANEVDDLYAIAWALLEPRLDIVGITSAQWHTNPRTPNDSVGESQKLNKEIIELMGKTNIPIPQGSNFPMVSKLRPQPSAAAKFIIEQALANSDGSIGARADIMIQGGFRALKYEGFIDYMTPLANQQHNTDADSWE